MYPNDQWGAPQGGPQGPGGYGPPPAWGPPPAQQGWGGAPQQAPVQQRPAGPPPDPDELLGGGYRAAQFPGQQYGTTVGGRIIAKPTTVQQRDFNSGQLKFYPDSGQPAWQIVVPVQTQDHTDDEDDGVRAFYLKGQMKTAVTQAIRAAGAERLEVGGELFIRYVRDEASKTGGQPKKIYEAKYRLPTGQTSGQPRSSAPISGLPMNTPPPSRQAPPISDTPPF